MKKPRILVLHGPNLNRLGRREPSVYGTVTLPALNAFLAKEAKSLKAAVSLKQSNVEGTLVTLIQRAPKNFDGLLMNPGGYSHTSVAIRDAIASISIPTVEVHLTNIAAREAFRHVSITAGACVGCVTGLGIQSYLLGLKGLIQYLKDGPLTQPLPQGERRPRHK